MSLDYESHRIAQVVSAITLGKVTSLALLVTLTIPAATTFADEAEKSICWRHMTEIANQIDLCVVGTTATMEVFYPNIGIDSGTTICRRTGRIRGDFGSAFVVLFTVGKCENGRHTEPGWFDCQVLKENQLQCEDERSNSFEFELGILDEGESRTSPNNSSERGDE